ncbi:helix-turn-helix domain-containing protein [Nocardia sp. CDC153]|uniref:helix-turn-helix domain-containing protein n=1 Tax=Nocardia sp. CDC153 TaxID=3112167 RepID=UPI002DBC918C|nr:helix-turn-helix domain-containing protein [Nocardia sp. CDC153]MEC3955793.1 helix-turn-helix domain-containing protein [Nocardia sp. CDC153]
MADNLFGDYIRQRREDAWLTRTELAKKANLSVSLIEKIELGTRPPTLHSLQILFDHLDVAPMYRRHILAVSLPDLFGTDPRRSASAPGPDDLADLETLTGPASLYALPTFTILAANAAHRRTFPGLPPGISFVEWMFRHPAAREVMVEWRTAARNLVHSLRMLSPNPATDPGTAELVRKCQNAPEWDELWHSRPPTGESLRHIAIRDMTTHHVQTMGVRIYAPEYPSRAWWLCRLTRGCAD